MRQKYRQLTPSQRFFVGFTSFFVSYTISGVLTRAMVNYFTCNQEVE